MIAARVWTGRSAVVLAGLAMLLAGIVGLELQPDSREADTVRPPQASVPPPPAAARAPFDRGAWVGTILARPLFSPDRRPPPAGAAGMAVAASLPRVTGILMDGGRRTVIFAATGAGRPVAATEGAEVNGFRVQSIEAGQVTVVGPGGTQVLRPSFDPDQPAPRAPAPPSGIPGLPSLQNMTGIPGLPPPGPPAR